MDITERKIDELSKYVQMCVESGIRLVKLSEYAFVEPGEVGRGAVAMIGKERIVLTAFDMKKRMIYRWDKTQPSKGMVTIVAGQGKGYASHSGFAEEANTIRNRLEMQGIQVVDGEWVVKDISLILNDGPSQ